MHNGVMAKTQTQKLGYASGGAVAQDGMLPVKHCKRCDEAGFPGQEIVWATSKRTGRAYPVNVTHGYHDQKFYMKHNVHKCDQVQADHQARTDEREHRAACVAAVQARVAVLKAEGVDPKLIMDDPEIVRLYDEALAI